MKRLSLLIIFCCCIGANGQNALSDYYFIERDAAQKGIKRIETITQKDIFDNEPYLSTIEHFNKDGYSTRLLEFDSYGDTIKQIISHYPTTNSEMLIFITESGTDTGYFEYNKAGLITKNIWVWEDDPTSDSSIYIYDDQNVLLEVQYLRWEVSDTFIYKNRQLQKVLGREPDGSMYDSTLFLYDNQNQLIEIQEDVKGKDIGAQIKYYYNELGQDTLTVEDNFYSMIGDTRFIEHKTFYPNGMLYKNIKESHDSEKHKWTITLTYNKDGILTDYEKLDEQSGKVTYQTSTIYYYQK